MGFEWDENKRLRVLAQRGIDFLRATQLFDGRDVVTVASPRSDEQRWVTTGILEGTAITVIWTIRGENIRLISARRARDHEKRTHQDIYG
jgi:uncharacterized DUF497 family protein